MNIVWAEMAGGSTLSSLALFNLSTGKTPSLPIISVNWSTPSLISKKAQGFLCLGCSNHAGGRGAAALRVGMAHALEYSVSCSGSR